MPYSHEALLCIQAHVAIEAWGFEGMVFTNPCSSLLQTWALGVAQTTLQDVNC